MVGFKWFSVDCFAQNGLSGNIQGACELGPEADGPSLVNLGQGSLWEGFNTPTCDNFAYGAADGFHVSFSDCLSQKEMFW